MFNLLKRKEEDESSPIPMNNKTPKKDFIDNFDETAYLEANPDVKDAIANGQFQNVLQHIETYGYKELAQGMRKFHKDVEPFSEETYLVNFPEVEDLVKKGQFGSVFDHFCKKGYSKMMATDTNHLQAHIDNLIKVDDNTLFIHGWCYSENNESTEGLLISTENAQAEIFHHPRADLKPESPRHWEEAGFYGIIHLQYAVQEDEELVFLFELGNNRKGIKKKTSIVKDAKSASELILGHVEIHGEFRKVFEKAFGPALHNLWDKHYRELNINPECTSYGSLSIQPELSIIVPLYGRIDFMEYQLAIFANDPLFKSNVELIYILDDPERFQHTIQDVSEALYNLTEVPFKVVTYEENLGYARANNIGVSFATSEKILLLNSDVFPRENEWINRMLHVYSTLKDPGVLGFKLLFEDNAVQHAGMIFEKNPYLGDMWTNLHPHKGMPDLEKDFLVKEVPAVTGACMLVERDTYLSVGGLSENYVLGDFEDSDLCLKLMAKGLKIYYSTEPSLYHLERQSQSLFSDQSWKFKITVFNCWQQTKQWNNTIEKTMEHFNA